MPGLSTDQWREFLNEPGHLARIGTVDADGMPRVLPLWFIMDGDRLCFTPRSPAIIWHNIVRDPRAGISIDEEAAPYRKLVVQGVVEIVHQPGADDAWRDLYRAIASRYVPVESANAYVDGTSDQPRALCAIDLTAPTTRMQTWRMPVSGEDPRGIWHPRYYV
jgi:nitroimidazol reductase NimA-like FMN-containing flavoprotein (pyridoxamine 5'-phosphate oxidase superfamily)